MVYLAPPGQQTQKQTVKTKAILHSSELQDVPPSHGCSYSQCALPADRAGEGSTTESTLAQSQHALDQSCPRACVASGNSTCLVAPLVGAAQCHTGRRAGCIRPHTPLHCQRLPRQQR